MLVAAGWDDIRGRSCFPQNLFPLNIRLVFRTGDWDQLVAMVRISVHPSISMSVSPTRNRSETYLLVFGVVHSLSLSVASAYLRSDVEFMADPSSPRDQATPAESIDRLCP